MSEDRTDDAERDVTGIARQVAGSAERWGEAAERLDAAQDEIARSREQLAEGGGEAAAADPAQGQEEAGGALPLPPER